MRIVQGVFWWTVTIVTLFVLDDLMFGPAFWALSLVGPLLSTVVAFIASAMFQAWLIRACIREYPGKVATFFLSRLMLERKNVEIAHREASIKKRAASSMGALLVTPLLGATIPAVLLYKKGIMTGQSLYRLSAVMVLMYSVEFALLHGGYGLGALVRLAFGI